jgi:2-keto-4-pentenoate hydratase
MEELLFTLAKDLALQGKALKPGDLVSLGSFSRLMPPKAGLEVEVEYLGLPGSPRVAMAFR